MLVAIERHGGCLSCGDPRARDLSGAMGLNLAVLVTRHGCSLDGASGFVRGMRLLLLWLLLLLLLWLLLLLL